MISHLLAQLQNHPPLRTERMRLVPLTLAQMQMQLDDYAGLERSLGARVTGNRLEKDMYKNVTRGMDYMRQEAEDAIWNTFWAAVLEEDSTFVGGIGFKGPANAEGEVELGYGFDAPYQNRGLATEYSFGTGSAKERFSTLHSQQSLFVLASESAGKSPGRREKEQRGRELHALRSGRSSRSHRRQLHLRHAGGRPFLSAQQQQPLAPPRRPFLRLRPASGVAPAPGQAAPEPSSRLDGDRQSGRLPGPGLQIANAGGPGKRTPAPPRRCKPHPLGIALT
jgi:hypothetical protein